MKPNLIFKILVINLIGLPVLLKAQVSENFTLSQNELIFQKNADFDELTLKDYSFTEEIGNPQLPIRIESFVIPYDAVVSGLQITSVTKQKNKGKFYIYPTQPPRPLDGSDPPAFVEPNPAVYNSSAPYPGKTAEIISDEYMHGYHIVTVKIYPVEYIPKNREVYLQDISFTINYSSSKIKSSSIIQPEKQSYKRAELAKKFIKGYVKNVTDVENFKDKGVKIINESSSLNKIESTDEQTMLLKSTSAIEELVPDYIIITNEALKPTFQTLADWKTKKGFPAIIKTIEEIEPNYPGSDLPEKIRNYLKEAYSKWGASLYILLGGDVNIIPARFVPGYCCPESPTDLYYSTVTGTWNADNDHIFGESSDAVDYSYDFFLGRASVENTTEAQTFVNKLIAYEKYSNLGSSTYVNNINYLIGFLDKNECGVYYSSYTNSLKSIASTYIPSNINNWFVIDNHNCQFNSSSPYETPYAYSPYVYEKCNPSKPTTNYVAPGGGACHSGNQTLNKTNAIACLNNGSSSGLGNFHIIYHLQHSGVKGMGLSKITNESFRNEDFDGLSNGNFHQILFTNGCKPGTFSKDCIGEHYINNSQGGGVAFIGNADYGYYGEHTQFQSFCDALYETTGHPSTGYNLGFVFQKAPGTSSSAKKRLTLLGDPEMPVWTNTPQTLNVSVSPTTVVSGENTIVVTINNLPAGKTATICLQKGDEGYATQTVSANGSYNFTFTPHTSGQINVTVTSHNFKPYESTITVNTNQNQNIFITDLSFDDDKIGGSNGNNDQQIDAGETIELTVELKNNGASSATNVFATLTCSSPYVSISNNNSSYGDISSGATKSSLTKYVFTVDKDAPEILVNDLNPVKFTLQITDGASNSYTDVFNIDVFKPEIEQANKTIVTTSDGDKIIEPNETVTINIDLFNKGKAQATGITGALSGNSSYITSCSATPRNYPAIDKFSTGTSSSVYQFTVSPSYTVGQALDFILQVENEFGKTWSFNFNLFDKPAKINTSTIDFTADKTEIELFWTPYTNISDYNIYRSDADASGNPVGNYQKLNTFVVPAAFYNDFGLNELTKYYYKISAVSLTGNESELSDAFLAWTSYPSKGLFPVQMDVGNSIVSSINAADINSDNIKEIFTNISIDSKNSYLIGLNSDGTELFDIDGNVTTYSGFAHLNASMNSTPAIGDLESNGQYKVLSMTRDGSADRTNYFSCHSVNDNNNDGKPDLIWQHTISSPCYRAPIIANLDNSSDGSLESVFYTEWGGIRIYSATGQLLYSFADGIGGTYGSLSVADIDGNGDREIIGCYANSTTNGIYIWHHNGSNYGSSQPYYTLSGYNIRSSSIICDLDNDGDKEILTAALKSGGTEGRIVAIHHNGTVVSGWNGTQKLSYPNDWHSQDISVGDLNNDGNLEVVAIGTNIVKVWNKSGTQISSTTISNLNPGKLTPILADVDNDADIEIIFGSNDEGRIHALNMDGTKVLGFPLHVDDALQGSPCIADVDNNGKSELIAGSGNKIYMWETNGNSQLIEWGSERHDPHNTGEYYEICPPTIITSNTTWSTNKNLCGDIIINSGTLTIASTCTVTMSDYTKVLVNSGGELKVDAGKIMNANIKALSGSNIILKSNGYIKISDHGEFNINTGATFDYQYGTLDITQ
jgi:hypothetical protein